MKRKIPPLLLKENSSNAGDMANGVFNLSILIVVVGFLTASAQAAKRDMSAFKGKYKGTTAFNLPGFATTGPAVIRFKTKSKNRAADISVTGRIFFMQDVASNVKYKLRSNGKASADDLLPGFTFTPTFQSKYKSRKRKITSVLPFFHASSSISGFVKLNVSRRATKKRAFLKIKHDVILGPVDGPVVYTLIYEGSRRIKRS